MLTTNIQAFIRSLRIYRFNKSHRTSLQKLYRPFVRPGHLAFDIGAHAGDRTACFNSLKARVVCVEPQPLFSWFLRFSNLVHPRVTVLNNVVSEINGAKTLMVNSRNPTVSTLSNSFVQAANAGAIGWEGQVWDERLTVQSVTLDRLIERYGVPDFIKIDVEGAECDVLNGLTHAIPYLSFEFTLIQRNLTFDCIARCQEIGLRRFNVSMGETHALHFSSWVAADTLIEFLSELPEDANSGDIYASSLDVSN